MRRLRNRGPSSAEIIRQANVRKLLCRYGAYSRQVCSKSASSLEMSSSSAQSSSRSSRLAAASSSSIQLASATSRRAAQMLQEDSGDLKLNMMKPSQLLSVGGGAGQMDKGLALAAAQHVARLLASGEDKGLDAQTLKEDFLHQLERDYGFTGGDALALGRIKITIRKRDNDLEIMRRRAEMERQELEKNRLMQEKGVQLRSSRRMEAVSSSSSSQQVQSTTRIIKTSRVVKTTKRTVQTVRAA